MSQSRASRFQQIAARTALAALCAFPCSHIRLQAEAPQAATQATGAPASFAPGVPFSPEALAALLPPAVYFQGKTASLQLRNAGAVHLTPGSVTWAAMVDTSGYASDVQERYQFYFVTETPVRFGSSAIPAGVYGGGFVGDRFLLMDVGGHIIAEGPTEMDAALKRPRPLQMLPPLSAPPGAVRLYLGRRWIRLQANT